jgi:sulfate adenylyltransferase
MIPLPHGGRLVDTQLPPRQAERVLDQASEFPKLWPEVDQLFDTEKIGIGAYSPLNGFMDHTTFESVLQTSRLPNSLPWTIPIYLSPPGRRNQRTIESLRPGDQVTLLDPQDRVVALLHFEEKWLLDRKAIAQQVYRTQSVEHPNVADLQWTGGWALGGPIDLVSRLAVPTRRYEMTPAETRETFARRHWNSVAGYQTRNVPHRAHEYLQRLTLEREDIDGLLLHPVVGRLKPGDYRAEVVVQTYETLVRNYFPADRVLLATLSVTMRYAGPKAALFLAIVRKNYGCSHYIVGRDQAGIGNFYDPYDSHRIFDELPAGIIPLRYREAFYCLRCDGVASPKTCPHSETQRTSASQSRIRQAIREGKPLPESILRPEIRALLLRRGPVLNDGGPPTARWPTPRIQDEEGREPQRAEPAEPYSLTIDNSHGGA